MRKPWDKNEKLNKNTENIKKNQRWVFLESESTTKLKNSIEIFNSRFVQTEEKSTSEKTEQLKLIRKAKGMKRNEESPWDWWNDIKRKWCVPTGVPEGQERGKETESLFKEWKLLKSGDIFGSLT